LPSLPLIILILNSCHSHILLFFAVQITTSMASARAQEIAFKNLFDNEYDRLVRYALLYLPDMHQAEDVVQETFVKIWEQKQDLIATENIRFYLVTAVRNNCISALRKLKKQPVVLTDNAPEPEPEPLFHPSQFEEQSNEQVKKITDALNQLPPKCREVFLMVKLHGMSYKQAAETLELSVKTIENQMGKAIRIFRDIARVLPVLLLMALLLKKHPFEIGVLITQCVL